MDPADVSGPLDPDASVAPRADAAFDPPAAPAPIEAAAPDGEPAAPYALNPASHAAPLVAPAARRSGGVAVAPPPHDVSPGLTLGVALCASVVGLGAVRALLGGTHVAEILLERGWVPYATVLFALWAAAILAVRARRLRAERRHLREGAHALAAAEPIDADAVSATLAPLRSGRAVAASAFARRAATVLDAFASRGRADDATARATAASDADAQRVESSFVLPKVIVWAIPILGFVGTVLGIGDAVGGFSGSVRGSQDLDAIKGSLGDVTTGLSVAFDTTLLALVASLLLMFPMSALQRAEEGLLAEVDLAIERTVLPRLVDRAGGTVDDVARLLDAEAARGADRVASWAATLGAAGQAAAERLAGALAEAEHRIATSHERQLAALDAAAAHLAAGRRDAALEAQATQEAVLGRLAASWATLERTTAGLEDRITGALDAQARGVQGVYDELAGSLRSLQASHQADQRRVLEGLATTSERLSGAVERLAARAEQADAELSRGVRTLHSLRTGLRSVFVGDAVDHA
jgi:biopolymer transport protein ExbB/TolQ